MLASVGSPLLPGTLRACPAAELKRLGYNTEKRTMCRVVGIVIHAGTLGC